jgi:hypothetical protein
LFGRSGEDGGINLTSSGWQVVSLLFVWMGLLLLEFGFVLMLVAWVPWVSFLARVICVFFVLESAVDVHGVQK